jgi:hypothetical protein
MQHDDIGTERTIVSNATFETFLDRLAKQLRTSPQVGNQIIDELQDHYEDRLADLLSDGWERGAAEERALKEFGEATQLANNFRSVFRNRRRRMAMRMTAGTIALATLVGMVLMFGGPDQEPGKAVAQKKGNSPPPARAGGGAVIRANSGGTRKKAPTAAKRKTLTIEENNAITEQNLARPSNLLCNRRANWPTQCETGSSSSPPIRKWKRQPRCGFITVAIYYAGHPQHCEQLVPSAGDSAVICTVVRPQLPPVRELVLDLEPEVGAQRAPEPELMVEPERVELVAELEELVMDCSSLTTTSRPTGKSNESWRCSEKHLAKQPLAKPQEPQRRANLCLAAAVNNSHKVTRARSADRESHPILTSCLCAFV